MSSPTQEPRYGEEARRAALEEGSGVSPLVASIAIGETPPFPPTTELPPWPKPPFKPVRTGHVRGEPGTPSGRDLSNAIVEASQPDPAARPFDPRLREALATKPEPKPLRKYLQRNRDLLRSFGKVTFLDFRPLSKTELRGAEAIMTDAKGDGALSVKKLFNLVQGNPQGLTRKTWEVVRRERAENAVSGRFNKWADYVEDSRYKVALLTRLQGALGQDTNPSVVDVLRQATAHPESYKMAFDAAKALVQHLDIKELSGTEWLDIPFDPMRESKSDGRPAREGAKKRITDAYADPENAKVMVDYVIGRLEQMSSDAEKRAVADAIDMFTRRGLFWETRLQEAFDGTAYQDLGAGVFAAVGIEAPK